MASQVCNVSIGRKTALDAIEELRRQCVASQRTGDNLLVDLGKTKPDFRTDYTSQEVFPADLVFNRTEWLKEENYIRYVKEEENYSIGGLNPGFYNC